MKETEAPNSDETQKVEESVTVESTVALEQSKKNNPKEHLPVTSTLISVNQDIKQEVGEGVRIYR